MYHCIVINNEYLVRERISSFVEEQESWQVDGQSKEYKKAGNLLLKYRHDVCFINIIRDLTTEYRVKIFISVGRS